MKRVFLVLLSILLILCIFSGCEENVIYLEPLTHPEETTTLRNNNSGEIYVPRPSVGEITYEKVMITPPAPASDFKYNVIRDGTEIEIFIYTGEDEIVVVPERIENIPVTTILRSTFKQKHNTRAIYLPDRVTLLDGTFEDLPNLELVLCKSIKRVENPPFDNSPRVVIGCSENSFLQRYAINHKIKYVTVWDV